MAVMVESSVAGIFINPYLVAAQLQSSALIVAAWVAGGLITLAGGFIYRAEPRGRTARLSEGNTPIFATPLSRRRGFIYG